MRWRSSFPRKRARSHLLTMEKWSDISIRTPCGSACATLRAAVFVEGELNRGLAGQDHRAGELGHLFEGGAEAEGIDEKLVVVAAIGVVEAVHHVERFTVERADREGVLPAADARGRRASWPARKQAATRRRSLNPRAWARPRF